MNKILKLSSYALCLSLWFYAGCSGGDEPEPFDCDTSDLELIVENKVDPSSCTVNDGSFTVLATGGKTPYQYKLNNGNFGNSSTFSNLSGDSYGVIVKDANGCEANLASNVILTPPGAPEFVSAIIEGDTECTSNNGSITVSATGGTGDLSYSINGTNFQSSNVFSNLLTGSYTITIKDELDCQSGSPAQIVPNGTGIDYDNDILAILEANCNFTGCHPANGNWFDFNTAKSRAAEIKRRITLPDTDPDKMPRTGSLTSQEISDIVCWVDNGTPKN